MKRFLVLLLTLTTIEVVAQDQLLGVVGGLNWTNVSSKNFLKQLETKHKQGVLFGITYDYPFKQHLLIGADIIYNQRGIDYEYDYLSTGNLPRYSYYHDYLSVPLKIGLIYGGKKKSIFIKAGIVPSLLIKAKSITPDYDANNKLIGTHTSDDTKIVSKFDLGGLIEIGSNHRIVDRLWLTPAFVYQHSITTITNSEYFSNSKILHRGMSLTLGFKWSLKKE